MFNPREFGKIAQRERIGSAAKHRLNEPPAYPSARLHPSIARIVDIHGVSASEIDRGARGGIDKEQSRGGGNVGSNPAARKSQAMLGRARSHEAHTTVGIDLHASDGTHLNHRS